MLGKSAASKFWMLVIGFKSAAYSAGGVDRGSRGARLKLWVLNAVFFLLIVLGAMVQGSTPAIADICGTIPSGSVLNGFPNPTLTCNAGPGINASAALNIVNTTDGTGGGTVIFSAGSASGYLLSSNSCSGGGCNTSSGPVFICNSSVAGCTFTATLQGPGSDEIIFRGSIMSGGTTSLISSFITRRPIAVAGPDQTVASGSTFTLDGSASNAPTSETNDSITSYLWFQTAPTFSTVPGSGPLRTITAPVLNPGDPSVTLTYSLSVDDSFFQSTGVDTINVTVNAPVVPEIGVSSSESGAVADGGRDAQGSEPAGVTKTVTYTINNTGTGTLTLSGTPTTSNPVNVGSLTVSPPASNTIAAGASTTFTVSYTPTIAGAFSFDLDIGSDDADENPYDIAVSGTATGAPEIEITSSETGSVADGGTDAQGSEPLGLPKSITYTVTNTGTAVLSIPSSTFSASNFVNIFAPNTGIISSNMIPPGGSGSITIIFTPISTGPFSFDLDLVSNDVDESPYDITVSGTAFGIPEVDVSSSESGAVADGGTDAQGSEPAGVAKTATYTINNTGTDTLTLSGTPTTSNPVNVGSLTVSPPASNTIAAGASTTFSVSYTPTIAGAFSFDLDIGSDDADENPYDIAVSGTATGAPEIEISSSETGPVADGGTDSLGNEPLGVAKTLTYTITNTGTADLSTPFPASASNLVNVSTPSTSFFSSTIPPGTSDTFTVTFTPLAAGPFSFDLDLGNNDADESPYDIAVVGNSTGDPEIAVSSSESGAVGDGGTDAQGSEPVGIAKTVTYTLNNTGTDTLTLSGTPTTSNSVNVGSLTVSPPASNTIAAGASTTFTVSYTPTIAGAFSFDLDIGSDDADENPYDIAVSGTANGVPEIEISSSETGPIADGGTDTQGAEPAGVAKTVTYTITNTGTDTLTIFGTPSGSNFVNVASTSITLPSSSNLAPGASATFTVTYTPVNVGPFSLDLDVVSNDADENPYDIQLSGNVINNPPLADAGPDQTGVASGATVTLDGSGSSDSDPGDSIASFAWSQTAGTGVTLSSTSVSGPTFSAPSLNVGDPSVTLTFELTVTDTQGSTATDTVSITVDAPGNNPPLADAGPDQTGVASGATVTLDGSGSSDGDPGDSIASFAWAQTAGTGVTLDNAAIASPTFTAPSLNVGDPSVTLTFELTVTDTQGSTATDTVSITVDAPGNNPPLANAGPDQTGVASGATVTLDGSGSTDSDPGDSIADFAWTQTAGTIVALSSNSVSNPTFTAPSLNVTDSAVTLTFSLIVTDTQGADSIADTVDITVSPPSNNPPLANAGPDQSAASGAAVALDGSASIDSDPGDSISSFSWGQVSGTVVTLSDDTIAAPTFTAPTLNVGDPSVTLSFALTVTDQLGATNTDFIDVIVNAPGNNPPLAIAGPDQTGIAAGATVTLDGSGSSDSDPGDSVASFAWTQTTGTAVTLSSASVSGPTFTAPSLNVTDSAETLTFSLVVTDTQGAISIADTVDVAIDPPANNPPVAAAIRIPATGLVAHGTTASMDATASNVGGPPLDPGDSLSFSWVQIGGANQGTITGANTATPSFVANNPDVTASTEIVLFQLTVTDALGLSDTVNLQFNITPAPNTPPVADAGPDQPTVASGAGVSLDGSGSNVGGSPLDVGDSISFNWVQTGGTPVVITGGTSATPSFTAPFLNVGVPDEVLTFELTVTDALSATATDTVQITVQASGNNPPLADAGPDQTGIASGAMVTLDGSASSDGDPGDSIASFAWSQTAGTGVTLDNAAIAGPTFTAPSLNVGDPSVTLTFELTVTDTQGSTATDTVSITVDAPGNNPPLADAGPDQTGIASGAMVTLDGSASSDGDPGDSIASFAWSQTAGTGVTLDNAAIAGPTFTAPSLNVGDPSVTLTFELTVTDTQGSTATDTVSITVDAPGNNPPLADAGPDQTGIASGAMVTLDGSASSDGDPGDSIASFAWVQTSGTGVTLDNTAIAGPTFTAPSLNVGDPSVTLTFELTVTDTQGSTATDTVAITVDAPGNNPPLADAGPDQTGIASGATVTLDGSGSTDSDPGDSVASFAWVQTSGTGVTLSDTSVAGPTFTAPSLNVGDPSVTLTFELTVTDTQGATATDTASITVNAPIAPSDPTVVVMGNPDGTVTVSGDADPDTTITVTFPDGSEAMATVQPDGTYMVTSPTPQTSGTVTAVSTDTIGNSSNPVSVVYVDTVAPQDPDVNISDDNGGIITVTGTAEPGSTVTITFPDGSQGTDNVGPDGTYSVSSSDPQPDGPVTVVVTDPAGNSSNPVTVPFINGDVSAPTVEITGAPQVSIDPFTVTIVFNEDVNGFELSDISVSNGAVSNFVVIDAQNYRVTIDPSRETDTSIDIPANVANDLAGNGNLAATQVVVKSTIVEDTQQVIASFMSNRANHILNNQPDLIDFVLGGHIGKGGPLGSLDINSNEQNLALAFSISRSKILAARDRASAQVQDRIETSHNGVNGLYENNSVPASDVSLLSQYSSELKNDRALTGLGLQPREDEKGFAPSRTGSWDVWTEIYGSVSNSDMISSSLWVGYLGAHYFISENQLVGVIGQLDWAEETDASRNSHADGVGWMIGPYVAGKFEESDLYYEARVAYGLSSNDVSPTGTFTDGFDTERFLARAKLQGVYDLEEFIISPSITFSYFEETQSDYTDTFGNLIPEQTISLGELRFGPEIGRTFTLDDGTLFHASLGVSGIYNFAVENNASSQGFVPGDDDFRARLDATIGFSMANGSILRLEGYYDGIGADDYEAIGGGIRVTIPLK